MEVTGRRFTISVSDELAIQLDRMKQAKYYNTSQNKMIQDLIRVGIETTRKELGLPNDEGPSNAPKVDT